MKPPKKEWQGKGKNSLLIEKAIDDHDPILSKDPTWRRRLEALRRANAYLEAQAQAQAKRRRDRIVFWCTAIAIASATASLYYC